jgi:hypothetical protein
MNTKDTFHMLTAAILLAGVASAPALAAGPYLVGFELYRCNQSGTAINSPFWFYSTNPNVNASRQSISTGGPAQAIQIIFPLATGTNQITFSTNSPADPGAFAGVELFFSDNATSFNPVTPGVVPHLCACVSTSGGSPFFPAAGTGVIDYGNSYGPLSRCSGSTVAVVAGHRVTLTGLTIGHVPSGSLTLSVEPCLGDFNHDFAVDFFDYLDFLDAFANNHPDGDFNGDGVVDFFDYLDFVSVLAGGC